MARTSRYGLVQSIPLHEGDPGGSCLTVTALKISAVN